jgi:hypothetical protein
MSLGRGRRINLNLPARRPRPGLGHRGYVVRQADGEVVLRTTDAVYARRFLAELRRLRPIQRGARSDPPGEA